MTENLTPVALTPRAATQEQGVVLHAPAHAHALLGPQRSKRSPQERRVPPHWSHAPGVARVTRSQSIWYLIWVGSGLPDSMLADVVHVP